MLRALESAITLTSAAGSAASVAGLVSAIRSGKKASEILRLAEEIDRKTGGIEKKIEHLSDRIIVIDTTIVGDRTLTAQERIRDYKELYDALEPVQRLLNAKIVSSALIATPRRMDRAITADPNEVLMDITDADKATLHSDRSMVPIRFLENGIYRIGWQKKAVIPSIFDCDYRPELWRITNPGESESTTNAQNSAKSEPHQQTPATHYFDSNFRDKS